MSYGFHLRSSAVLVPNVKKASHPLKVEGSVDVSSSAMEVLDGIFQNKAALPTLKFWYFFTNHLIRPSG